jgi:hypothetical protein
MSFVRIAALAALAGLALTLSRQRRRGSSLADDEFDAGTEADGVAVARADSPNDAERLQARGIAETPRDAFDGGLFGSNSQQGAEPKAPGLPDFSRGA